MADIQNENGQVVKRETVEVVDNGQTLNTANSTLSSIFDKIEAGKNEGRETPEILADLQKETPPAKKEVAKEVPQKEPEKKEAPAEDKKEEKPAEEKSEKEKARELLFKSLEKKDEKKDEKPEEKKDDDVPEEELQVLASDKPKTAKRIQALLKKAESLNSEVAKTRAEKEALAKEREQMAEQLKNAKTVNPETEAQIKAQLDELAMYRRRYELDKDPDVKNKFDARVESAEKAIVETLTKRNAGKGLLDLITAEGGWQKFSESNRIVTIPDGEEGTRQVTTAELAEIILQALPLADRKSVEAAMLEQVQTKRDKDRYIKEQQEQAVTYFKKKDEEAAKAGEQHQKQVEMARKTIEDYRNKVLQSDWIKDKEVPANASAMEKAAIEEHNKYNAQLRSIFDKAVSPKDGANGLNDLLDVITDSVRYYDERRTTANLKKDVDRLRSELEAKSKELDRYKNAGRSTPKAGSIAVTAPSKDKSESPRSLEETFELMERGQWGRGDDE